MIVFSLRFRRQTKRRGFRWGIRACREFVAIRYLCRQQTDSHCRDTAKPQPEKTGYRTNRVPTRQRWAEPTELPEYESMTSPNSERTTRAISMAERKGTPRMQR